MSPQLILPKHKVRAASHLVNNLKNCSGKKPAAAAAVTPLCKKINNQVIGKKRKTPDRNGGGKQNGEQRPTKDFYPAFTEIKKTNPQ